MSKTKDMQHDLQSEYEAFGATLLNEMAKHLCFMCRNDGPPSQKSGTWYHQYGMNADMCKANMIYNYDLSEVIEKTLKIDQS